MLPAFGIDVTMELTTLASSCWCHHTDGRATLRLSDISFWGLTQFPVIEQCRLSFTRDGQSLTAGEEILPDDLVINITLQLTARDVVDPTEDMGGEFDRNAVQRGVLDDAVDAYHTVAWAECNPLLLSECQMQRSNSCELHNCDHCGVHSVTHGYSYIRY
ncbi:hypothetical protein ECG_05290 [Echinococcus granulosus]|uniref:Ubiquitin-like domain-containing protein n=1 Tax=Echinococcus granulosus TaxID=6210 RepID=A0A068WDM7_ECHGR|nr:hypothetical protein ECG_05290 [Echinococcus granulosus]CDS18198.1 hypothetical protein EgrG_000595300 [Echinococcus granulosus]